MSAPVWPKWAWKAMKLLRPLGASVIASYAGGVWLKAGKGRLRWEAFR